jgi:hypothetical protein
MRQLPAASESVAASIAKQQYATMSAHQRFAGDLCKSACERSEIVLSMSSFDRGSVSHPPAALVGVKKIAAFPRPDIRSYKS